MSEEAPPEDKIFTIQPKDSPLMGCLNSSVMSPLQEQAAKLGICGKCHAKSLELRYIGGGFDWHQCRKCQHIFMLDEQPKLIG